MPIYRKILTNPTLIGPTTLTDMPGLSPISIQAGSSNYSFIATLSVSGLSIPNLGVNWGAVFRIMQGSTILGSYYLGELNGGFRPSFSFSAVGDSCSTGITEDIHVKWKTYGTQVKIIEPTSFSILYDDRLN